LHHVARIITSRAIPVKRGLSERELEIAHVCLRTGAFEALQELGGARVRTCFIGSRGDSPFGRLQLFQYTAVSITIAVCAPDELGVLARIRRQELRIVAGEQTHFGILGTAERANPRVFIGCAGLVVRHRSQSELGASEIERSTAASNERLGNLRDGPPENLLSLHVVDEKQGNQNHPC
jgi:hypothetical protein